MTCILAGTELFFGLAAALDDRIITSIGEDSLIVFPLREIRIASGSSERIPMRVYSVRQRSVVTIKSHRAAAVNGFKRVTLAFDFSRAKRCDAGIEIPEKPVMAFMVAIGLDPEKETTFFEHLTEEFLDQAWMSLPSLLQEVGCSVPDDVAEGDSSASSCSA